MGHIEQMVASAISRKTSTIDFPKWVKVTKCRTFSESALIPGPHGVVKIHTRLPIRFRDAQVGFRKQMQRKMHQLKRVRKV